MDAEQIARVQHQIRRAAKARQYTLEQRAALVSAYWWTSRAISPDFADQPETRRHCMKMAHQCVRAAQLQEAR